jgi:hypothetical protein
VWVVFPSWGEGAAVLWSSIIIDNTTGMTHLKTDFNVTLIHNTSLTEDRASKKVKQSRYRSGVAQRVPGI